MWRNIKSSSQHQRTALFIKQEATLRPSQTPKQALEYFFSIHVHSFFYKHTGKLGWSSICLRFSQFVPEIMLDSMLNFKTHFMVWYCVWYEQLQWSLLNVHIWIYNLVWHEHCNGLFNIRNLVSGLILMFARICLCDAILYTWFGKK